MPACEICLRAIRGKTRHHPACVEGIFGVTTFPSINMDRDGLDGLAAKMVGKLSISGVQEKISLALSSDRRSIRPVSSGGRYILKPEPSRFRHLPQNEHLTMRLAELCGIEIPPLGLIQLTDGSVAYLIKRFDRMDDGTKLHVEDFCQLSEKTSRDKYQGSMELCVRILRRFASEPPIEIRKLYRLLLFSWWVANGDHHLKNFSLIVNPDGMTMLSPAYDLVNTRLVLPHDRPALTMLGDTKNFTRRRWLRFASYCEIARPAAERLIANQVKVLGRAEEMIGRSFLPDGMKRDYEAIVRERTAILKGP